MIKVYKLKYNLPTFWAGDICVLDENGDLWWHGNPDSEQNKKERRLHWREKVCIYHRNTLEKFNILDTYFEEVKDIKKLWPFEGCEYYYVDDTGVNSDIWGEEAVDYDRRSLGNCYMDKEDAERVWKNVQALCKLKQLGCKMTSFQLNENKGMVTIDFIPEQRKNVSDGLTTLLGGEK